MVSPAAGAPGFAVAVDDTSAYFTSYDTIWKILRAGDQATILVSKQGAPSAIAVDATSVYFTNTTDWPPAASGGQVVKLTPK